MGKKRKEENDAQLETEGWSVGMSGELFVCSCVGDPQENRVVCSGNLCGSQHTAEPGSPSAKLNKYPLPTSGLLFFQCTMSSLMMPVASKPILLSKKSGRQRCGSTSPHICCLKDPCRSPDCLQNHWKAKMIDHRCTVCIPTNSSVLSITWKGTKNCALMEIRCEVAYRGEKVTAQPAFGKCWWQMASHCAIWACSGRTKVPFLVPQSVIDSQGVFSVALVLHAGWNAAWKRNWYYQQLFKLFWTELHLKNVSIGSVDGNLEAIPGPECKACTQSRACGYSPTPSDLCHQRTDAALGIDGSLTASKNHSDMSRIVIGTLLSHSFN